MEGLRGAAVPGVLTCSFRPPRASRRWTPWGHTAHLALEVRTHPGALSCTDRSALYTEVGRNLKPRVSSTEEVYVDLSVDSTRGGKDVDMGPWGCPQAGGPGWDMSGGSLRPSLRGEDSRQSSGQCERSFGAGRSLNGTGPPGGALTLPPVASTPQPTAAAPTPGEVRTPGSSTAHSCLGKAVGCGFSRTPVPL